MGVDVWLIGLLFIFGIVFIIISMCVDVGVVIFVSYNFYYDNGIKIFGYDGFKLLDVVEIELEKYIVGDMYYDQGVI